MSVCIFARHYLKVSMVFNKIHIDQFHLKDSVSGLFHRAITQSGHPLKTVMKPGEARLQAWTLARIVGCGYAKCSEELLQCLQAIPVEVIVNGLLRDKVTENITFMKRSL